ncbi:MAG: hypothetical protein JXR31_02375 [Prolixibacteraceae bacterium]|nr:hypothetical protein [Prolixibacteraceae bacterium]MBN2773068.1 hypothetical protein [Prolixibacteraceae bacterium]
MKSIILKSVLIITILATGVISTMAQKTIKGTVYQNGEPMAGVRVEAHRGGEMLTSFDGKYEVAVDPKNKYLKFIFIDEIKKKDLDENSGDVIDFYWDGIKPAGDDENGSGVNNKSMEQLINDKDVDFMQTWSLYDGFYSNKDYNSALPHWEKLYNQYPKCSPNIYIRGTIVEKDRMEKAPTLAEKVKHLNKMMEIYDKRIKNFGEKGYVLGRKGVSWFELYLKDEESIPMDQKDKALKTGYEWLAESTKLMGEKTEVPVIVLFMNVTVRLFKLGELPKETVVSNYDLSSNLLNKMLEKGNADNIDDIKIALDFTDDVFSKSGAADCEALLSIYGSQFEQNSGDINFLKKMLARLRKSKCDESDLYNNAAEKLYELDPSPEAAFNMARRYIKLSDFAKAKEYYKEAMDQETNQELLATYYYEYGLFIFAKERAYQEAREYARKALSINPNYCDVLMLIGDIYVAASSGYDGNEFQKSTIFWLAVDYYTRAARASEDCYEEATQKANDYKKYFPNKEEVFFQGLTEGENYKIEGWINETTKVRF